MLLLDVTRAPLAEGGVIELAVLDSADHYFRVLYAADLVDRCVAFFNE